VDVAFSKSSARIVPLGGSSNAVSSTLAAS
jgi:hypothetical protein